ncbi:MAG: EamA family transporter [Flavobacteriales bacterium]|nr:EamA family transporter [Flavobacteriales bacterium]
MIDLLITIGLFNIVVILFKLFPKYKVDNLQALIFNYITAASLGVFMFYSKGGSLSITGIVNANWFLHSIAIGVLFIVVFNFYAFGTQKVGVAISTVANKMSMIFPTIAGLVLYAETNFMIYKVLGFIFAIVGIYLTSTKNGKLSFDKKHIWIILAIFVGQGIADILFGNCSKLPGAQSQTELIFVVLFIIAALVGFIMLTGKSLGGGAKFEARNILWGIAVGLPNYGTLFFMFRALQTSGLDQSEVYPIISMGAVFSSALIGWLLFKEKLNSGNWLGIAFAILGIAIITFGKYIY